MSEGFDLGLFLGSIPVILQLVADCDLFFCRCCSGCCFCFPTYKLTSGVDGG